MQKHRKPCWQIWPTIDSRTYWRATIESAGRLCGRIVVADCRGMNVIRRESFSRRFHRSGRPCNCVAPKAKRGLPEIALGLHFANSLGMDGAETRFVFSIAIELFDLSARPIL
jgi:hypothetical protein